MASSMDQPAIRDDEDSSEIPVEVVDGDQRPITSTQEYGIADVKPKSGEGEAPKLRLAPDPDAEDDDPLEGISASAIGPPQDEDEPETGEGHPEGEPPSEEASPVEDELKNAPLPAPVEEKPPLFQEFTVRVIDPARIEEASDAEVGESMENMRQFLRGGFKAAMEATKQEHPIRVQRNAARIQALKKKRAEHQRQIDMIDEELEPLEKEQGSLQGSS